MKDYLLYGIFLIIVVIVIDKDFGFNVELIYIVSDDNFVIEIRRDNIIGKYIGDLRVVK